MPRPRFARGERQLRLVTDKRPGRNVPLRHRAPVQVQQQLPARPLKGRLGLTPDQLIGKRVPEVLSTNSSRSSSLTSPVPRQQNGCVRGRGTYPHWRAAILTSALRAGVERRQSRRTGLGRHRHYRPQAHGNCSARERLEGTLSLRPRQLAYFHRPARFEMRITDQK
jgi:hypothetical protein